MKKKTSNCGSGITEIGGQAFLGDSHVDSTWEGQIHIWIWVHD